MKINAAHGGGGKLMNELIRDVFQSAFSNDTLDRMEDAAVLPVPAGNIALTTDSFVVTPLFFPGGDIGKLAVCGTVNDLLMRGATPKYLTAGFILEDGLDTETLRCVALSMRQAADEAGVLIVAGDTKVIDGKGGLYINTAGVGLVPQGVDVSVRYTKPGDAVIISGYLGNHHACILSARMGIESSIVSDCAPLNGMVRALLSGGVAVHSLRDITRGGLASVLHEVAVASGVHIALGDMPLADTQVSGFCDILGLDPLYMGNEGKLVLTVPEQDAARALSLIQASPYGADARIVGSVLAGGPLVTQKTRAGGNRAIEPLLGEGLPRIC